MFFTYLYRSLRNICQKRLFPRQCLKRFTSRVKSSDSIFFCLGFLLSSINLTKKKVNLFETLTQKILFTSLRIVKRPKT